MRLMGNNPLKISIAQQAQWKPTLFMTQSSDFSTYFRDLDEKAIREFNFAYCGNKAYYKTMDKWKVPLEKKKQRRLRKEADPPHISPPDESGEGLTVIHKPENGIVWPPIPDQCFAVISVKGL